LRSAPDTPEERLNFLKQGQIVHEVLAEWWAQPQDITALFERMFARYLLDEHIPPGYHTERLRNSMLDDLLRFTRDSAWPRDAFTSRIEQDFTFDLAPGVAVRGRIDRLDTAPGGEAYVIDYKYSRAENVKGKIEDQNLLQAPLYLMAAEQVFGARAAGVFYVGLRTGLVYAGWSESPLLDAAPMPEQWLDRTRDRALEIVRHIREGHIAIHPAEPDKCIWCDARDLCRVELARTGELVQVQVQVQAEGA
jgi:RecB family exonuclease